MDENRTAEFLRDLAQRLRKVPPVVAGTDGWHVDMLYCLANNLENQDTDPLRFEIEESESEA